MRSTVQCVKITEEVAFKRRKLLLSISPYITKKMVACTFYQNALRVSNIYS